MRTHSNRGTELNTSSVADIAFLLLVYFMVTTVIKEEKGLSILLPVIDNTTAPMNDRNVFNIQINSANQFMVEGQPRQTLANLRSELKKFILNYGRDRHSSESPEKAIISLKTDHGTTYRVYIETLDEIQSAYYEIYAERAGISAERFRKLDLGKHEDQFLYKKGREGVPMNISIAEPTQHLR